MGKTGIRKVVIDPVHQLALETIQLQKQAIIFVSSRASAEKTAEDIANLVSKSFPELGSFPELEKEVLKAVATPTKQCRRLSHIIKKGIAFHHAGLTEPQKGLIEDHFRKGAIKIICATPTLAAGLSLPAYRVIISSLKRYTGTWGMDWIPVLEYLQMAGRAGRPEYESEGQAITLAKTAQEKEDIFQRYICGVPEEIYSKLAVEPVLRTYLLSLISSGIIRNKKNMQDFFSKTFWARQFQDMPKLEKIMDKILGLLQEWQFITVTGSGTATGSIAASELVAAAGSAISALSRGLTGLTKGPAVVPTSDFVPASTLQRMKPARSPELSAASSSSVSSGAASPASNPIFFPTTLGRRVSELYLDPLTARAFLDRLEKFTEDKDYFSLIQMITHSLEMRPLLRVKAKEQDLLQEELVKRYHLLLEEEPSAFDQEYGEFMGSIKTALFFESWINETDEDQLLERFDIRPGEIRVKLESADWLLYATDELAKAAGSKDAQTIRKAQQEIRVLRIRVKHGVKEELLQLLKLKGIGRIRARRLFNHGIKDLGDIKKVDETTLGQILGKMLADSVKKQVGEEIKEIPKGTRKGQLSMEKF